MPRGKKGKLKKMKEKYKDQDEEDRQARMMLLQVLRALDAPARPASLTSISQPEGKKELRPAAPAAAKGKAPQKGGAKPKQSPVQAKHAPSPPHVAEEPTKPTEELAPEAEAESKPQEEVKVEGGAEEEHSEGEAGTEVKKEGEKRKGRKEKREEKLREQVSLSLSRFPLCTRSCVGSFFFLCGSDHAPGGDPQDSRRRERGAGGRRVAHGDRHPDRPAAPGGHSAVRGAGVRAVPGPPGLQVQGQAHAWLPEEGQR
jgi:hypothetical protein